MRPLAGLFLALVVVTAGCSAPSLLDGDESTAGSTTARPDPAGDTLGWENGYWYDDPVTVEESDGLNDSERSALLARTMARVEQIRQLEYTEPVPVRVVSRATYRTEFAGENRTEGEALRRFDNAKFEALFLVGERDGSIDVQRTNRESNVLGFYSPDNESIVVVTNGSSTRLSEVTLAHELVHALQDQHFGLASYTGTTREEHNAVNGLIEGDASFVQQRYQEQCTDEWDCVVSASEEGGGTSDGHIHYGIYFVNFFPYSDGPPFVGTVYEQDGWKGVNAMYDDPPESTGAIIDPVTYGTAGETNVTLHDQHVAGWKRVRPNDRPDYAELGQSSLSASFAYTIVDGSNEPVISRSQFVNIDEQGRVDRTDPFDYDIRYTSGLSGDRLHAYARENQTAYVWKLDWDSPSSAETFVEGYDRLLSYWGGERVAGREGVWRIQEGPFADAFRVQQRDDTVVIVNAPTVGSIDEVRQP